MQLTWSTLTTTLGEPFTSNKGTVSAVRQTVVRLAWGTHVGYGTAVFAKEYGLTEVAVESALARFAPLLADGSPFFAASLLARLRAEAPTQTSALAAVDMALHDLLGKAAGVPLHLLWGLGGLPIPETGLSLGAMDADSLAAKGRELADWPILKLKLTPGFDLTAIGRLRDVYTGRIWVDGNGVWDAARAIAAAKTLHTFGVELLEQPIPAGRLDDLARVQDGSPLPIVADEDCHGYADVGRLRGVVAAVNVKLLKAGGLRAAFDTVTAAREAGLKVMLGCKTESVLGVTATAQLAGLADYLDLDGHLDLVDDPFTGLRVDRGRVGLPAGPGLGVTCPIR